MSNCSWAGVNPFSQEYHDHEWGVPVHDDIKLFEYLLLETMQCGLSWSLILKKRPVFAECFDNFDYNKIAKYTESDIDRIINTEGMIRSLRKVKAIINNAQRFLEIRSQFGSFANYIWAYSENKTIVYKRSQKNVIPSRNILSDLISKDLRKRGFKFMGSVCVYSFLQACGIINDHEETCQKFQEINENYPILVLGSEEL